LNDFLSKELFESGYAGCEVRVTPNMTEVIIRATKTSGVVGEKGQKIRELTALVTKRFKFKPGTLQLVAEKVKNRGLSSLAQAEAIRFRLFEGLSVRRACYSVLKFIKERGAKGCEVVISGKLRGQRAKSMKFREGYMLHAGDAVNYYIDEAVKHLHLKQGVLGIKVKIMLPYDPTGKTGVPRELPDVVIIHDPKDTETIDNAIGRTQQQTEEPRGQAAILQEVVNEMRQDFPQDQPPQDQPPADSNMGGRFGGRGGGFQGQREFRSDGRQPFRGRGNYGQRAQGSHNYPQYGQDQGGNMPPQQQFDPQYQSEYGQQQPPPDQTYDSGYPSYH